jgi:hypothetical protein
MATVTTNFNFPIPQSTDLVKDGATAIAALGTSIDTQFVDLKGGTTGQILAKNSNTDLDYSWVTTDDANAIQNAIVDAKGDLIAATANDTPARLAVGSNGQVLVADSSATTGLRYVATPSASNPVLNSAFNVWQRGTSFATQGSLSLAYSADRFQFYRSFGATGATLTRVATGDTTNLPFIQYAARLQRDSGNTSTGNIFLTQSIESVNSIPFAGKTVTFSFYARAGANYSPTSSLLTVGLVSGTGTDQNVLAGFTGQTNVIITSATLTTTWQRFTFTSGSAIATNATQLGLQISSTPTGTAGANDYFDLTGIQIDIGNVALPFRTAGVSYQEELAMCQRYYYRATAISAYSEIATGFAYSTTAAQFIFRAPVTFRQEASSTIDFANLAVEDPGTGTITAFSTLATNSRTKDLTQLLATGMSGLTQYRPYNIVANNNSSAYLGISAEL